MQGHIEEYRKPSFDIQKQVKMEVMRHLNETIEDLKDLLTFTLKDLEKQLEEEEVDKLSVSNSMAKSIHNSNHSAQISNQSAKSSIKIDFDTMLEFTSMKQLKKASTQKQYL